MDLNGDGLLDRVVKEDPDYTYVWIQFGKRDGTGFEDKTEYLGTANGMPPEFRYLGNFDNSHMAIESRMIDINGNGRVDWVLNDNDNNIWLVQRNTGVSFHGVYQDWVVDDLGSA